MEEGKLKKNPKLVNVGAKISYELYEKLIEKKVNISAVCRRALELEVSTEKERLEITDEETIQEILKRISALEKKQELLESIVLEKAEYLATMIGAVKEDIYSVYENIKEILEKQDKPIFLKKENKKEYRANQDNGEKLKKRLLELRSQVCTSSEDIEKFNLLYSALKNTAETSEANKDKVARMYQSDLKLAINEIIELSKAPIYDAMVRGWELMKEREE